MKIAAIVITVICLFTLVNNLPEQLSSGYGSGYIAGYIVGTFLIPGILWIIVLAQTQKKKRKENAKQMLDNEIN